MIDIRTIMAGILSVLLTMTLSLTLAFAGGQQQKVTLRVDGLACRSAPMEWRKNSSESITWKSWTSK